MALGASAHFRMTGWDYDRYVPIVQGALENTDLLITASKRGPTGVVFQAAPRGPGDRAVEVEVQQGTRSIDVHVLVYPVVLLPKERDRFRIWEGAMAAGLDNDARSKVVLERLLTMLRRDLELRPPDSTTRTARDRAQPWVFFDFKAGRVTWFLGALMAVGGVAYLLLYAPPGEYQASAALMTLLAFGAIPFLGGLWGRSGPRGAFTGLVAVLLPALVYALAMAGMLSWNVASSEDLAAIASRSQFQGAMTYVLPVAFATAGLVAGGIGGLFGGRVFPLLPRESAKTAGI